MKKERNIFGKAFLLSLCTALLLLAGCSSNQEPTEHPLYTLEMTDENSMEITFVNTSDYPVKELKAWWTDESDGFDLLHNLGRNLEPGEVISLRIPRDDNNTYSIYVGAADGSSFFFNGWSNDYIPEGGILILLPGGYFEGYDEIQTIFEAGTDVETAKDTALSQYWALCEIEPESKEDTGEEDAGEAKKWKTLENLSQEEIDEALELLGYDSLEDMRTKENPDISFKDYNDEYEREKHSAFYDLYGYWYPNGDINSLKYIGITDQELIWYQFDPEQGDVEVEKLRISSASGGTFQCSFTLADGNSFTVERTDLLLALYDGKLTFEDCTKQYCDSAEYSYSLH